MAAVIRVIPSTSLSTSLVIIECQQHKVLVNCSEGAQRILNEYKQKLHKLSHVLFTRVNLSCTNGLCGTLLTTATDLISAQPANGAKRDLNGSNVPPTPMLDIYGPFGTARLLYSLRTFFRRPFAQIGIKEIHSSNNQDSEFIHLNDTVLSPNTRHARNDKKIQMSLLPITIMSNYANESVDLNVNQKDFNAQKRSFANINIIDSDSKQRSEFVHNGRKCVNSYIAKFSPSRGKFLPEKAIELGINPGRDYAKLTRGEPVTNDKGQIIRPEQCIEKAEPDQMCLFLDLDLGHVSQLAKELFGKYALHPENDVTNQCDLFSVFHLASQEVVSSNEYIDKIIRPLSNLKYDSKFKVKHFFLGEGFSFNGNVFYTYNTLLNSLEKVSSTKNCDLFPCARLETASASDPNNALVSVLNNDPGLNPSSEYMMARKQYTIDIFPEANRAFKEEVPVALTLDTTEKEAMTSTVSSDIGVNPAWNNNNSIGLFNHFKGKFSCSFLGTGASLPSRFRNVTALLLQFNLTPDASERSILCDCGEGSLYQLYKLLGNEIAPKTILHTLESIFISHSHADHHLGLPMLLAHRHDLARKSNIEVKPIDIIGPTQIHNYLQEVEQLDERIIGQYNFIQTYAINLKAGFIKDKVTITPVQVVHCNAAYGCVIEMSSSDDNKPLKFVFSGDTRPCDNLASHGKDCDILVHEATFHDGLRQEAVQKNHSTISDALSIGDRTNAKRLVLFHFSQRYPKIVLVPQHRYNASKKREDNNRKTSKRRKLSRSSSIDEADSIENRTVVAFDLMTLTLDNIVAAPKLLPELQNLFLVVEKEEEDDGFLNINYED